MISCDQHYANFYMIMLVPVVSLPQEKKEEKKEKTVQKGGK